MRRQRGRSIARVPVTVALGAISVLVAASVLPAWETEWWAVRLLDFPRLYWGLGLGILGLAVLPFIRSFPRLTSTALVLAAMGITINAVVLWPYRPRPAPFDSACTAEKMISVLIANVLLSNRNAAPVLDMVRQAEPDIFLAMETDEWWVSALDPLRSQMPGVMQRVTGSFYGLQLYSRLPLVDGEIRYLAGRDTPAVVTGVRMRTGEVVDFVGLHPKPPQVFQSALGRDAELYAAAILLRERGKPGILAGDLNATPWEAAVRRMRRLGGLSDPREGYGYVPTWNARTSWLRWPLDHVMYEGSFETLEVRRLNVFGSDHFPLLVRLCRVPAKTGPALPIPPADAARANEVLAAAGASERVPLREHGLLRATDR
jgi:endonuclease/exonuclease/phosphatase (EEP) superfamily protein YafD